MAEKDERRILSLLERQPRLTHPQMREILDIPKYRVKEAVDDLIRKRLIRVVNSEAPRQFGLVAKTASAASAGSGARPVPPRPPPKPSSRAAAVPKSVRERPTPDRPERTPPPTVEALPNEVASPTVGAWSMPKGCKQVELRDGERRVIDYYDRRLRQR